MPLDPFTGQQLPYGEIPEAPLPMRMIENLPGITTVAAFNMGRGSRTMLAGGGFMDDARFMGARRAARYGAFTAGSNAPPVRSGGLMQFGRRSRSATNAAGVLRDPWFRGARINNFTMRPRALGRMSSLSVFTGAESGYYSYAGGVRALGKMRYGPLGTLADRLGAAEGESILGPGLFSSISAGRRADVLERRTLAGGARGARAQAKLTKIDQTITRLAGMNNPAMLNPKVISAGSNAGATYAEAVSMTSRARGGLSATEYVGTGASSNIRYGPSAVSLLDNSTTVGLRGNMLVSSLSGQGTQYMGGFARGAMGFADAGGLSNMASRGAGRAVTATQMALRSTGYIAEGTGMKAGQKAAQEVLEKGLIKTLGAKGTLEFATSKAGARVAAVRGLGMASRAIPYVGTAMLVYDLAKMGGEIVKSGINLARDAEKSLQGSFGKPTFGMGYRDTEAAATSRARGVMAIQNSRLNARSLLGSEGAMMAAHFG